MTNILTVKLYASKSDMTIIEDTMWEYVREFNNILLKVSKGELSFSKISCNDIEGNLPISLKERCIQSVWHVYRRHQRQWNISVLLPSDTSKPVLPIWKKPCFYVARRDYNITNDRIEFPVIGGRLSVSYREDVYIRGASRKSHFSFMKIAIKNKHLVAKIRYN